MITPHPGEMSRLTGLSIAEIQANRLEVARKFAREHELIVVLKGHRTLIAAPDGTVWVNPTGNPGMATGGTGDILTGMVAGLIGAASGAGAGGDGAGGLSAWAGRGSGVRSGGGKFAGGDGSGALSAGGVCAGAQTRTSEKFGFTRENLVGIGMRLDARFWKSSAVDIVESIVMPLERMGAVGVLRLRLSFAFARLNLRSA